MVKTTPKYAFALCGNAGAGQLLPAGLLCEVQPAQAVVPLGNQPAQNAGLQITPFRKQVAHRLKTGNGLVVRLHIHGKERTIAVFSLKHLKQLPDIGNEVDMLAVPWFTSGRSDVMDRLLAQQCEYCGATGVPCEIHHSRKLADMKDTPLWKQMAAARRRKRLFCVSHAIRLCTQAP